MTLSGHSHTVEVARTHPVRPDFPQAVARGISQRSGAGLLRQLFVRPRWRPIVAWVESAVEPEMDDTRPELRRRWLERSQPIASAAQRLLSPVQTAPNPRPGPRGLGLGCGRLQDAVEHGVLRVVPKTLR
jgi:hypothetical protein